jgi:2-polyprenyl-3-methyl-5-hydroxy-6-metoxy-1,4-benzoquinol methylase
MRFSQVKSTFKSAIRNILANELNYALKEAALPAYDHGNPLIDHIFWSRLRISGNQALTHGGRVLDFGCGTGVMSYYLANNSMQVDAIDTVFEPLDKIKEYVEFPPGITWHNGYLTDLALPADSFDVIIALDVLEHIEDLDTYFEEFRRILKPGGVLVVSGPTENWLYKLGRKLAGKTFSGEYHVTNIADIKAVCKNYFKVRTVARLIWPLTLFEIFTGRNG